MHVHSEYSFDSKMKIKTIAKITKKRGLDGIALTDHNTLKGIKNAKETFRNYGLMLIPGVELRVEKTDYLIYFIEEEALLKIKEVNDIIDYVKENNGIIGVAHPYRRGYNLPHRNILERLDVVEVFNARNTFNENAMAENLVKKLNKTPTAGSDAHIYSYIGLGYIICGDDIKECLLKNKVRIAGEYPTRYMKMHNKLKAAQYMPSTKKRYYLTHPYTAFKKLLKK
ncbi:putative metal-dependent phosphoesterase, PHP family [Aciduliprofundum sp. MAR08-339]|nr:putative metal-dependent phosphoesterase, PHP family [Aciduliprofundum sp. MAR08-339]